MAAKSQQQDLIKYTVQVPAALDKLVRAKLKREKLHLSEAVRLALAEWAGGDAELAETRPWGRPPKGD